MPDEAPPHRSRRLAAPHRVRCRGGAGVIAADGYIRCPYCDERVKAAEWYAGGCCTEEPTTAREVTR